MFDNSGESGLPCGPRPANLVGVELLGRLPCVGSNELEEVHANQFLFPILCEQAGGWIDKGESPSQVDVENDVVGAVYRQAVSLAGLAEGFLLGVGGRGILERSDDGVRRLGPFRNRCERDPTVHESVSAAKSSVEWAARPVPDSGTAGVLAPCRLALVKTVFKWGPDPRCCRSDQR